MDLLDLFSCQLHNIAFDRLKSHTPLSCPGIQSINILLKFQCVFFILNFMIANTVISKKSYFRLNIWWDVIYVQGEQQGTKNGALGDTRQNWSPVSLLKICNCYLQVFNKLQNYTNKSYGSCTLHVVKWYLIFVWSFKKTSNDFHVKHRHGFVTELLLTKFKGE